MSITSTIARKTLFLIISNTICVIHDVDMVIAIFSFFIYTPLNLLDEDTVTLGVFFLLILCDRSSRKSVTFVS